MRIGISNIAWDPEHDAAIAELLHRHGVDAVDVAPTKYFADPATASAQDIDRVREWWATRGFEITGMQSLLFGTQGLNVFGPPDVQAAMLAHLQAVCRIGAGLGATRLVFGSPRNRDRSKLDDREALATAVAFFRRLGDIAAQAGVRICLEPNPTRYGANFMVDSTETAKVVRAVDHPAIAMQLDTGAAALNHESVADVLAQHADLIGHVHLSEPDLLPLGDADTDHAPIADAVAKALPEHVLTIEMLTPRDESPVSAVERAVRHAVRHYGGQA